ncbi:phage tail tape measure protein [Pannonibacter sp. P2PFMT1]|uniref:phage tail tape measure protein n=1 Tax=Pannonibacter sp. P2PFMT1 TaxID=2003582 RepID=UPI00164878AB|nr:phage tail tape measure protein [Pannonibacter sp. P2PFMT1]
MSILSSTLRMTLSDGVSRRAGVMAASFGQLTRSVSTFGAAARSAERATLMPLRGGMLGGMVGMAAGFVGLRAGFQGTVGAAISFQDAMADVAKVIDATPNQMANLRREILLLSTAMPLTAEGFASIYAAAGQSGIAIHELKTFAEMTAQVSTAWDTTAGETGQALAEIKAALSRDVEGVRQMADAINHLSNTSAASAPRLLAYQKRVASFAEIAGYSAEQAAAFGAAMIGAGNEPEVAATSFRNMTRALTAGGNATKRQREALKGLGLDSVAVAKRMQKDAVGQTLDVIDRIGKLPEWKRISVASRIFGDEARGLAPLFANTKELRRLLGEVGDATKYAGSALKEYEQRAKTFSNTWQLTKNKLWAKREDWGAAMLPGLNEALLGVNDILDTLGSRVSVFDQIGVGFKGLMAGLGGTGSIRDNVNALGDLLLGSANGGASADSLGRLFMSAKGLGETLRSYGTAFADFTGSMETLLGLDTGTILGTLGTLAGYGFTLAAASVGFGLMAAAVTRLGSALLFLTGIKTAFSILSSVARAGKSLLGSGAKGAASAASAAAGKPAVPGFSVAQGAQGTGFFSKAQIEQMQKSFAQANKVPALRFPGWGGLAKGLGKGGVLAGVNMLGEYGIEKGLDYIDKDLGLAQAQADWMGVPLEELERRRAQVDTSIPGLLKSLASDLFGPSQKSGPSLSELETGVGGGPRDVRVVNPAQRPNLSLSVTVNHSSTDSPEAIGRAIGQSVLGELGAAYSDGFEGGM